MFTSSHKSLLLSYFCVPHTVGGNAEEILARVSGGERALLWPRSEARRAPLPELRWGEIPLFADVWGDEQAADELGAGWEAGEALADAAGARVASVWRNGQGSVFLPFDPDAAITAYWSEAYKQPGRSRLAMRGYYAVRPALPRSVQIGLRRAFSRVQARVRFPRWPVETALHDLYERLFGLLGEVAGRPVPRLAPWPEGRSWALVLTHDVEQQAGYDAMGLLRDLELDRGYRSSWNFVPRRYDVEDALVDELWADGFEVGVHGLYHDGRDLESRARLEGRLPAMREWAERWHAVGFRSPATHRHWELMPLLGFDYDSSYPDTDPFEPQSGGCCSLLPFEIDGLVELPLTLPQDHTVFVILRRDEALWHEKTAAVRARGGLALLNTHPDYMLGPERLGAYERFLARYAEDESCWRALPRDVSAWWRRRAASTIEPDGDGWRVAGPAAGEARIET